MNACEPAPFSRSVFQRRFPDRSCNPSGRPESLLKSVKLQILCTSKVHSLARAHCCCTCLHRQNEEKQFAHTQTPFSRFHYAHSHSQTGGAADTSYLTSLPSSDMSPHKAAQNNNGGEKNKTNTVALIQRCCHHA